MSAHARPSLVALTVALIGAAVLLAGCATPSAAPTAHALADSASLRASGARRRQHTLAATPAGGRVMATRARSPGPPSARRPARAAGGAGAPARRPKPRCAAADAARQPQLNASADLTHQRFTENGLVPPAAGRRHALEQQRADRRRLGARPLRPSARRARCGARQPARGAGRRTGRTRAAGGQRRRSYFNWRARSKRAASPAMPGSSASRSSRWCASVSAPGSTRRSSCARPKACVAQSRVEIEALDEAIARSPPRTGRVGRAGAARARHAGTRSWPAWRRSRCPSSCRPTCSAAAPISWRSAGASRPRRSTPRSHARSSIPTSTSSAFVGLSASGSIASSKPVADLRRRPGAAPAACSMAAGCGPTSMPDAPRSTRRSRPTTARCYTRCAKWPTSSPACARWSASSARRPRPRRPPKPPTTWRCSATAPASATSWSC